MTKAYIISVIKKQNNMTNKAKQTWKKVPLHMAYQRGYEVEECGLKLIKQTFKSDAGVKLKATKINQNPLDKSIKIQ